MDDKTHFWLSAVWLSTIAGALLFISVCNRLEPKEPMSTGRGAYNSAMVDCYTKNPGDMHPAQRQFCEGELP